MKIRPAKVEDKERFVELGIQMHKESSFKNMHWCSEKIAKLIDFSLLEDPYYFIAMAEDEEGIQGFMGGVCFPSFFGDDKTASDLAVYVTPEKRGGTAGVRLIKEFVKWSEEQGAVICNVGSSAGIVDEGYLKLLNKLGFETAGFFGRKQLKVLQTI